MNSLDKAITKVCRTYGLTFTGLHRGNVGGSPMLGIGLAFEVFVDQEKFRSGESDEEIERQFMNAVTAHLHEHFRREIVDVLVHGKH